MIDLLKEWEEAEPERCKLRRTHTAEFPGFETAVVLDRASGFTLQEEAIIEKALQKASESHGMMWQVHATVSGYKGKQWEARVYLAQDAYLYADSYESSLHAFLKAYLKAIKTAVKAA